MSAIVNAAAHRLEKSTGGVATAGANLSLPQPPVAAPASATELVENAPTEFGGLTHLFGGGSLAETAGRFLPVNTALEKPGGSIRGALGGLKPDFRNAAQKTQQAIETNLPNLPPGAAPLHWWPGLRGKFEEWTGRVFRPGPPPAQR